MQPPNPHESHDPRQYVAPPPQVLIVERPAARAPAPRRRRRSYYPTRDHAGRAWLTLVAYLLLWPVGVAMNLVFIANANTEKRATGRRPQGAGCLSALLFVFVVAPAILGVIYVIVVMVIIAPSVKDEVEMKREAQSAPE